MCQMLSFMPVAYYMEVDEKAAIIYRFERNPETALVEVHSGPFPLTHSNPNDLYHTFFMLFHTIARIMFKVILTVPDISQAQGVLADEGKRYPLYHGKAQKHLLCCSCFHLDLSGDVLELFKYHLQVYTIPPYLSPATSLIDPRDEDYAYFGHPPVRGQQPIDYITIDDSDDDDDNDNDNGQQKMDMPSASTTATQEAGQPQTQ